MSGAMLDRCECTCGRPACASVRGRQHGTASCYRDGCRCDDCSSFESQRVRDRDARRAQASAASASKAGQHWTGAEMETVMRDDLSVHELASMLGRSYKAVVMRRTLCRSDPKWSAIP